MDDLGWEYYSLDGKDEETRAPRRRRWWLALRAPPKDDVTIVGRGERGRDRGNVGRWCGSNVKNKRFYDILGVLTNADVVKICRAYPRKRSGVIPISTPPPPPTLLVPPLPGTPLHATKFK
jgi:hypothetical protein